MVLDVSYYEVMHVNITKGNLAMLEQRCEKAREEWQKFQDDEDAQLKLVEAQRHIDELDMRVNELDKKSEETYENAFIRLKIYADGKKGLSKNNPEKYSREFVEAFCKQAGLSKENIEELRMDFAYGLARAANAIVRKDPVVVQAKEELYQASNEASNAKRKYWDHDHDGILGVRRTLKHNVSTLETAVLRVKKGLETRASAKKRKMTREERDERRASFEETAENLVWPPREGE